MSQNDMQFKKRLMEQHRKALDDDFEKQALQHKRS